MRPAESRLAICVIRHDRIPPGALSEIVREMAELGTRLGRAVDLTTIVIAPTTEGPWATIATALARTGATDVIVPDLEHVYGIDQYIRQRAQLITLAGERILQRVPA